MRKVLLLILVLIGGYSYGQVYQQMSQYGVEFKRMDNDSVLRIPRGLGSLRSISGYDTAQIRYNVSDSSVYVHTGNGWIKVVRGADADSSVFATVHKLYTTIDCLGNLIISENLGNTNLTQTDAIRTYDGDGGELSFSNLGKFKVSASDSVVVNSSVVKVKPTSTLSVDSIGYMEIKHYDENGDVLWYIDDGGTGVNVTDGVTTSSFQVSASDFLVNTKKINLLASDSILITNTPSTLTTDYDVLVRDENTGKVGIATISGGADSTIFSTNYRRDTAIANVRSQLPLAANPSASIGLSAVNGSATTFMRSDAAPALSQAIAPTWTGLHTFTNSLSASSGSARSMIINPTLTATANYDTLVGLDLRPTFVNGAFSGVQNYAARLSSAGIRIERSPQSSIYGLTIQTVSSTPTFTSGGSSGMTFQEANGGWRWMLTSAGSNLNTPNGFRIAANDGTPNSSSMLELVSTSRGFLTTRMTTTQRNAIGGPASGLLVHTTDSTKLSIYDNGRWNQIPKVLINTSTLDFGSTSAQSSADLTITVTGAADGDMVSLGVANAATLTNSCYTAWVSAADTVTVRFNNYSSGSQDPASATFKVQVFK